MSKLNHKGTVALETPRLSLRPFQVSDDEPMYNNWASDPEVTRYLTWKPHPDLDETRRILAMFIAEAQSPDNYHWAIVPRDLGQPIGAVGITNVSDALRSGSLGYCIGKAWWGDGVMSEAVTAVLDFMFGEVGLERIEGLHDVQNPASGRVMQKVGMRHEGTCRKRSPDGDGVLQDVEMYAILDTDRK